ncbi:methyltransferase domain-containing protein [Candidatus Odyssella thessalonicensis]|uniref:methyltransferase domain-containing protein n=1 Tax=Candidatus Odyssella thessalonicensis TaxID=84647 RepID=UPI000225B1B3|nr:methyltransferase domain-containing protein [Candidatus Odyssella thessalonicensis]
MDPIFNRQLQLLRHKQLKLDTQHPLHHSLHALLHERLSYIKRDFQSVLIIGDFMYSPLTPPHRIVTLGRTVEALSEHLPFPASTFDLVISYMDLHHANDVPGILKQINYCLKSDGLFLGAFMGGTSLWQLRAATQQAELITRGGCSPRVAPLISLHDAAALLQRAGFAIPVLDHEIIELTDNNPWPLFQQLKSLGLSNSMYAGFKGLSGKQFFAELSKSFMPPNPCRLELDILLMSGWAPAANQQRPLPRGSAQYHLSQILQ